MFEFKFKKFCINYKENNLYAIPYHPMIKTFQNQNKTTTLLPLTKCNILHVTNLSIVSRLVEYYVTKLIIMTHISIAEQACHKTLGF